MPISYKEAIAYSHNYATAKPNIGETEKEHILGLCSTLEQVGKERDEAAAGALAVAAETMAMAGHGPRVIKDLRDLAAGREEPDKPVDKAEAGDAGD